MIEQIQVLVVESFTLLREIIVSILESEPSFKVVSQCASAEEALRLSHDLRPDLILLDMEKPVDGIALAQKISTTNPNLQFLFLTISKPGDCPFRLLTTGERIYVLQNIDSYDLFQILKALYYGKYYLPPALAISLLCERSSHAEGYGADSHGRRDFRRGLTRLEEHILRDLAAGLSIPEVGLDLHLSAQIIKQSIARILRKQRVHSRFEEPSVKRFEQTIGDDAYMAIEIGKRE